MKTLLIFMFMLDFVMVWCGTNVPLLNLLDFTDDDDDYVQTDKACFPGDTTVTLEDGTNVIMKNLKIGERVKSVLDDQIDYTEVKTFLKRQPTASVIYSVITTNTGKSLTLSGSHLVFVSSQNNTLNMEPRLAETVKTGEYVFTPGKCPNGLCPSLVSGTEQIVKEGAYVPLTDAGTLVVNDVFVSCYDSLNHDLAHVLAAPARWFPWILTPWQENGYSPIVQWVKYLGQLIAPNSPKFHGLQTANFAGMKTEL